MAQSKLKKFKAEFRSWCGFPLESETLDDIKSEIKSRQWQMECDLNAQAKALTHEIEQIIPED